MSYKGWKLIDKIDVAVRTKPNYRGFTGYVVEHGDKKALEDAKNWARVEEEYDRDKREYIKVYEAAVHTFENEGFTARIVKSAGGSYQGGRLSFWMCEIEKDGIKFTIGVNDAILADLIRNSDISNGLIKQKVMFARQGGQPGLIHENMQAYKDALADMQKKADLKKAKKTSKWEVGGVYSTLTQTSVCLGEVFDTLEPKQNQAGRWPYYNQTTYIERSAPIKMLAWINLYRYSDYKETPTDFTELLEEKLEGNYVHFEVGKPPARPKAAQLEVKESDYALIDKILKKRQEYVGYGDVPKVTGRYVRELS
jgi:hypothetical protein